MLENGQTVPIPHFPPAQGSEARDFCCVSSSFRAHYLAGLSKWICCTKYLRLTSGTARGSECESRNLVMPEFLDPVIEVETIRRIAGEDVKLSLTQAEVEALHNVLNSLVEEIRQISPRDRAGAEPEVSIVVEEWPA
jgi:hypothetical protein